MDHPQLYLPVPTKPTYGTAGRYRRFQQPMRKTGLFKRKGIERWHRAVSTDLIKQNVLIPKEESSSESDIGFHESQRNEKKNVMKNMRTAFGRILPYMCRSKPAGTRREDSTNPKKAPLSNTARLFPRIIKELPSPRLFTKPRMRRLPHSATIQLDVEAETEEITRGNTFFRARRTTRRFICDVSAFRTAKGFKRKKRGMENILQKSDLTVGKLQMQVDDLIETVTDKSMKLLAQRHSELQQCEFLGDEILQSSKQFQRISKRTMRKFKLKSVCFPCTCCCF